MDGYRLIRNDRLGQPEGKKAAQMHRTLPRIDKEPAERLQVGICKQINVLIGQT